MFIPDKNGGEVELLRVEILWQRSKKHTRQWKAKIRFKIMCELIETKRAIAGEVVWK
jgi:hypothetical protein